jgi:hypothetical protein
MDADEIIKLLILGRESGPFGLMGPDKDIMRSISESLEDMDPGNREEVINKVNSWMETAYQPGGTPDRPKPMFKEGQRDLTSFLSSFQRKTNPRGAEINKPKFDNPVQAARPVKQKVEQNFPMPKDEIGRGQNFPMPVDKNGREGRQEANFDAPENLAPMEARGRAPAGSVINTDIPFEINAGRLSPVAMQQVPDIGEAPGPGASQQDIDAFDARRADRDAIVAANAEKAAAARTDWRESMTLKGPRPATPARREFGPNFELIRTIPGTPAGPTLEDRQHNEDVMKNRRTEDKLNSLKNPLFGNRLSDWFESKNREHGENSRFKDYGTFNDLLSQNPQAALKLADQFKYISAANATPITQASENARKYAEAQKQGLRAYASEEGGLQYLPANHPKVAVPEGTKKGTVTFDNPYKPEGLDNPFNDPYEDLRKKGLVSRDMSTGDYSPTQAPMLSSPQDNRRRTPEDLMGSWSYGTV